MLESVSERLCRRGGPHFGSPDKAPAARLETIRLAGEQNVPFTSGILIGIGETREERIRSLLALRDLNDRYGHLQEIIIQNFQPKPGTRMANAPAAPLDEHLWTIAMARLIFEPEMNIQAPPNLSPHAMPQLIGAGINDWGGVSPVTPDHVNPEAPWPHLRHLADVTASAGKMLVERLALYPSYALTPKRWLDEKLRPTVLRMIDGEGRPRTDAWRAGSSTELPAGETIHLSAPRSMRRDGKEFAAIFARARAGKRLDEVDIVRLMSARGEDFAAVCQAADELRKEVVGDTVSYVVTRNINYTNICYFKCQFCAFSKGKLSENLRGRPYDLPMSEVASRVREAWGRGATEVCMQGGIHPSYNGEKYLEVCRTVKREAPRMHIHAFSPLEIRQGAATLGVTIRDYLVRLKEAGLSTLPGTAAEILDDEVRADLCPDKLNTAEWIEVMRTAHELGIRSTATIMFGHIERYTHLARHFLRVRDLQEETGGFTEFVPLPFVHMEAPIYLKGRSRQGPSFREAVLVHAVARLVLHPHIVNIQTSWVKMGPAGAALCLRAGANDLGGTLMNETISRSAGASYGQEMTPPALESIIADAGRRPRLRNTLYGDAPQDRRAAAFADAARVLPASLDMAEARERAV
jgi:FO synthase